MLSFIWNNLDCVGVSDGVLILIVGGGQVFYSYEWSNGSIVQNLSGFSVGVYLVIVID